jgi:hypothetical protein
MDIELTEKQKESILRELMRRNYDFTPFYMSIEAPCPYFGGDGAVVIKCNYHSGGHIFLVIEKDGYTHS